MKLVEKPQSGLGNAGSTSAKAMSDAVDSRRRERRKETRCLAYIVAPNSRKELECVVLDMSSSGAKLRLAGVASSPFAAPVVFPQSFKLIIRNDRIEVDCVLCWSKGATCGVTFASPFRPTRA